jgi:hypothetical protein
MTTKRVWRHIAAGLIAAGPAGGFLFGVLNAGDPDPNPVGRFFHACMMAVQTPLHAGFPPNSEAGTASSFNVWPHITVSFLVIVSWLIYRNWTVDKKRNAKKA